MEYNSMSFLDDLLSSRGQNVYEKMKKFINKKIGIYTLRHFAYNLRNGVLTLDLLRPNGTSKAFSEVVDARVFQNSDYVLENYLYSRITGA